MAVNLKINVEVVDLRRAELMMDLILSAIEKQLGSGDKAKLGYERKSEIGRRKRTLKDDVEWVYGEERPELKELGFGFIEPRPMDALLGFSEKYGAGIELIARGADGQETRATITAERAASTLAAMGAQGERPVRLDSWLDGDDGDLGEDDGE